LSGKPRIDWAKGAKNANISMLIIALNIFNKRRNSQRENVFLSHFLDSVNRCRETWITLKSPQYTELHPQINGRSLGEKARWEIQEKMRAMILAISPQKVGEVLEAMFMYYYLFDGILVDVSPNNSEDKISDLIAVKMLLRKAISRAAKDAFLFVDLIKLFVQIEQIVANKTLR
jgi:hypothetical protein